jgi:hypothetical protein
MMKTRAVQIPGIYLAVISINYQCPILPFDNRKVRVIQIPGIYFTIIRIIYSRPLLSIDNTIHPKFRGSGVGN